MVHASNASTVQANEGSTLRQPLSPAVVAWLRLARVYHKIDHRTAHTVRAWDLSVSRFDVLNHVGTQEGRNQTELAKALLVTKGNVCQILDSMEADGLIERRRHGRNKCAYLTERGRQVREESARVQEGHLTNEFSVLSDDEQAMLSQLLRKLERSLPD